MYPGCQKTHPWADRPPWSGEPHPRAGLTLAGVLRLLATVGEGLADLLFPPPDRCLFCGDPHPVVGNTCAACLRRLRSALEPHCPRCGRPVHASHSRVSDSLFDNPFDSRLLHTWQGGARGAAVGVCGYCGGAPWDRVRAVGTYQGALRRLIWRFKYGGERWLARPLGMLLATVVLVSFPPPQMVVPVPLTPARFRWRGFNQAEALARVVAQVCGVPQVGALTRQAKSRRHQAGLGRPDRWTNLSGVFRPSVDVRGATILLVDDVLTTGATLSHCCMVLREAGAARVDGVVLAAVTLRR